MAEIWVPRQDLAAGDFPPVCAVTGEPTDDLVPVRFNQHPDWAVALILFGYLPFLLALWLGSERMAGVLPMRHEVRRQRARRVRQAWAVVAGGLGLVLVALALQVTWVAGLGFAVIVFGGLAFVPLGLTGAVNGRLDRTRLWVKLTGVHPSFVAALMAEDGAEVEAPQLL